VAEELRRRGLTVDLDAVWAALPTVTPTAKPAVSPIVDRLAGATTDEEFRPHEAASGKALTTDRFAVLMEDAGWRVLEPGASPSPSGRAWAEQGDLDHFGHEHGWKLARHIAEQIRELADRVEGLLKAGWSPVRVVTDHGWLLLPGGLPKAELPAFLAATRWGRCALLKPTSTTDGLVVPWRWCGEVRIALAPGACCYRAGYEYAHGGLSLQECLTPVITVTSAGGAIEARLQDVIWKGLRCRVIVAGAKAGLRADLRTKVADAGSTLANGGKPLDEQGQAALLVEDDSCGGSAAFVVLVDGGGTVIAKQPTTVGGEG